MKKMLIFYLLSLIGTFSSVQMHAMEESFDQNLHEETRKLFNYFKKESSAVPLFKDQFDSLKAEQQDQRQKLIKTAHEKFFNTLNNCRLLYFYKPKKFTNDNRILKQIFEKNRLIAHPRFLPTEESWSARECALAKKALAGNNKLRPRLFGGATPNEVYPSCAVNIEESSKLLQSARSLLKSFVPLDEKFNLNDRAIQKKFINKKAALNRLFTYNKLQQAIEAKKLSHVHLPLKVLAIKDDTTNTYITGRKALKMMDDMMIIYIHNPEFMDGEIEFNSNNLLNFAVLAHKQERGGRPLSEAAMKDLEVLLKESPFDVGYDNIFADENGDAVIIDTEFKGEPSDTCILKLRARYWHK